MSPSPLSLIVLLAAGVSFGAAGLASRRPAVAGRQAFVWLMLALGTWSLLSDLHTLVPAPALKVAVAKLQYLSIASVSLLWLLVVHRAVGLPQLRHRHVGVLAVIPLLTVAAAWTNDWHGWLWAQITPVGSTLVYHHGPWFWVAVAYNYGLLVAALVLLVRALRHTPPPFHPQLRVMIGAAVLPWVGNVLYLTRAIPIPGLDPTPLAFTLSGLLFLWALTTYQFLDLVPIARSMLFDHIEDGVLVVDRSRRVVDVNPTARRLADLDAAVIGQPLDDALPALSGAIAASLDRAAPVLVEPFGLAAASVEVRATSLLSTHGQMAGWLVVLRDITTEQSLVTQLRAERDFALQVMQTMGEGLTVIDAAGRFTFVNDAYARLFGYAPADLIGRRPWDVTVETDHTTLQAAWKQRAAGQPSTYLSRLRCADGQIATVQITGTPRIVNGAVAGSIAVITDLRERLAHEEALRIAEQTLRSFFDSAGVMMGIVELGDDDILHVADNIVAAAFFGTSVEAMRGQWASGIGVPPETIQRWLQAYQESERTGLPVQFDYTHETPEGPCWLAVTVRGIGPTASGRSRCSYVALDITARKAMEQELHRSQQQLEATNAQLRELARTDGLTGLCNRRAFNERLIEEIIRTTRYHTPLSLLLIDIDHFKTYNDTYGHVAGDGVLRLIGQLFEEQARQSDLVARYGGEEFAIILPNTDEAESVLAAERIRRSVDRASWPERHITISIGVATYRTPWTAEQLVELTDRALYGAKDLGRNLVVHASQIRLGLAGHRAAEAPE